MPTQDGTDDQPPQQAAKAEGEEPKPKQKPRSGTVDLELDTSLQVEISDALSEQDKVKFTVHTKVSKLIITIAHQMCNANIIIGVI